MGPHTSIFLFYGLKFACMLLCAVAAVDADIDVVVVVGDDDVVVLLLFGNEWNFVQSIKVQQSDDYKIII